MARGPLLTKRTPDKARQRRKAESRLSFRIGRMLPTELRRYYFEKFHGDAETSFAKMVTGSDHVCEHCNCKDPNFNAVRMVFEFGGAVGQESQTIINVYNKIGVANEAELIDLLKHGRRLQRLESGEVKMHDLWEDAIQALRMVHQEHPELQRQTLERLSSGAEEVNGTRNLGLSSAESPAHNGTNGTHIP